MPTPGNVIFATAGYDHTIRLWNIEEANCYQIFQHPDSQVNDIDLSKDKKYLAAAGYHHLRLYDLEGSDPNPIQKFEGHPRNVCSLGFNQSNSWLYSVGDDGSFYILDHKANNKIQRSKLLTNTLITCAFLHPNEVFILCGTKEGKVFLWDLRADQIHTFIPEPISTVMNISIDKMGLNIAVSNDQGICSIWPLQGLMFNAPTNPTTPPEVIRSTAALLWEENTKEIDGISFQPPKNSEADPKTSSFLAKFMNPTTTATNALLLGGPGTKQIKPADIINNPANNKIVATNFNLLNSNTSNSNNDNEVSNNINLPVYLPLHKSTQYSAPLSQRYVLKSVLSPDAKLLAMCTDEGETVVWDVKARKILHEFTNPTKRWIWDASFTSDSQYLITASSDAKARLWDLKTGKMKREFAGHQKALVTLALLD